ncbi:kinesin-like protein KIF28P [Mercenaria mercenaria]|uniref:kinesin-like protein KIF28P n=1 Tax=Mercenaria mercenaria TaxID=6596 RepID=UPI00234E7131|nr:kinesin-like protein KIF28P [Mercenaria mercenaria]
MSAFTDSTLVRLGFELQVFIRVDTTEGGQFLWGKNHFQDRFDLMMEVFRNFERGLEDWEPKTKTQDPFWEPLETPTLVGVAIVPLESLAYMLDIEEQMIGIYDYQARLVGHLGVCLVPCTEDGEEMSDELSVEEPLDLLHKDISFKVKIKGSIGIPKRFKSSWCHYIFQTEQDRIYTDEVHGVVPKYNFEHLHQLKKMSHATIEYLEECSLMIELYGRQKRTENPRRGSTLDAFTLSDKRRLSSSTSLTNSNSLYSPISSACGSYVHQSMSGILLEEDSENEDEQNKADREINSRRDTHFSETAGSSRRTSVEYDGNSLGTTQQQIPDILLNSSKKSLDNLSSSMIEIRTGIASIMEEVIKRDGLPADLE